MSKTPTDLRSDIQRMYELSLAVGNSLDPDQVCQEFTASLMRQSEITFLGIWLLPEKFTQSIQEYNLYFAFPFSRSKETKLPFNHPAIELQDDEDFCCYDLATASSEQLAEKHCTEGSAAIFRLGALGYVRLLRDDSYFSQRELRQLRPIIEKLFVALGGALAYKQLHKERSFLDSLVDTIPELVWLKDPNGTYLACNTRFEEFFGALEHEIVGKTDYDFVDKELADSFRKHDLATLEIDRTNTFQEWVTFANDGHRALLETTKTPMKSASGDLIGVLGVSHEITQLHEAQQALSNSEAIFRSYFELGLIGMALLTTEGEWIQTNTYLSEMLGYEPEHLQITPLSELIHPDDQTSFHLMCESLLNDDADHVRHEIRLISCSGPVVHTEIAMSAQESAEGKINHFVTLISDISERKRTEQQLSLAASVFEHASEGVMITNEQGIILDVNNAFYQLTGYSAAEVIGHSPNILKSGHHSEEFFAAMWQSLKQNGHWRGEVWNRNKSGEIYAELLNIAAVKSPNGDTTHYVSIFSDITQLKEHQHQLEKMAHFDALTQLPNRVLLSDRLQTALQHCKQHKQIMAVAYIDLDEFKPINDTYGHDVGDMLLVEAAKRMQQTLGPEQVIARLGGDEFVVILTELKNVTHCQGILANLNRTLAMPFQIKQRNLSISASIGATLYPDDDSDADTMIRHADQAMYTAKQTGRNRYHFFDPAVDRQTQDQHKAQDEIHEALINREFVLFYQPKINMQTGKVYGVEALIRWQHPTLNLLPPDSFLPHITNPDLATKLGAWVMNEAIRQLRVWRAAGLELSTSINISAEHLQNPAFPEQLADLLAKYPEVPPEAIELEVLETTAFNDVSAACDIIDKCHKLGIKFALDDFGTGYSSLTYLRKIPADTVKIDRSFVMDMLDDDEDKTIVEGIIGLGKAFNRGVIAEGVESAEHGRCLMALGCHHAQGYGIAKPMPADLIPDWLAAFNLSQHWK